MAEFRTKELDLTTFLASEGFKYRTERDPNGKMVTFVFPDGDEVRKAIDRFPLSDVNRILTYFRGFHKLTKTDL